MNERKTGKNDFVEAYGVSDAVDILTVTLIKQGVTLTRRNTTGRRGVSVARSAGVMEYVRPPQKSAAFRNTIAGRRTIERCKSRPLV